MRNIDNISIRFSGLLTTLLTVLFVGLKLTHYIDWSWWWVLAPTWIPITLFVGCMIILSIVYVLLKYVDF